MHGSFEYDLFLEQLRQVGRNYRNSLGICEFSIQTLYTPVFGQLTQGDLARFTDMSTGETVIGIISKVKITISPDRELINTWVEVISGELQHVFHCSLNDVGYNDALLYTDKLAMHIDQIEILGELKPGQN